MARRSKNWNEGLAKDLRNKTFAQKFILAAVENEGLTLHAVLGKVIRAYGVLEFSKVVKMPSSNILRAINPKHNPTHETLSRLLKAFDLTIIVAPLKPGRRAA
jgi:DNA-binding phage protein